jgi:hypothetical protein
MLLCVVWCLLTDVSGNISVSYSRVKQSKKNCLTLQELTERSSRNVDTQTTNVHHLTSHNSEGVNHTSAEAHDKVYWQYRLWHLGMAWNRRLAGCRRWNTTETDLWTYQGPFYFTKDALFIVLKFKFTSKLKLKLLLHVSV